MTTRNSAHALALALLVAQAQMALAFLPGNPPPGSTVLEEGRSYAIDGRMSVRTVDGKQLVVLGDLGQKYYRKIVRCSTPMPGAPRIPPYFFVPVTEIQLASKIGQDLVGLAALVRSQHTVRVTGVWNVSAQEVGTISLRGHDLPQTVPTLAQVVNASVQALKAYAAERHPDLKLLGKYQANYVGGFYVNLTVYYMRPATQQVIQENYGYDALTGEIAHIPEK